jgi:hypothetical protein
MAKYLVRCEKIWEDWVEAENEDEAMDIAEEQFLDDDIAMDIYIVDSEGDEYDA